MTISIDDTETNIDHPIVTIDGGISGNPTSALPAWGGNPITGTSEGTESR